MLTCASFALPIAENGRSPLRFSFLSLAPLATAFHDDDGCGDDDANVPACVRLLPCSFSSSPFLFPSHSDAVHAYAYLGSRSHLYFYLYFPHPLSRHCFGLYYLQSLGVYANFQARRRPFAVAPTQLRLLRVMGLTPEPGPKKKWEARRHFSEVVCEL